MFDAAFASIATGFSDRFGGPFIAASAVWPGEPVKDAGGSILTPGTPDAYPCRAQFDVATQAMRQAEGFLETDVRILVLSLSRALDTSAKLTVATDERAGTWQLLSCQRDPVGVGWECRGRRV